MDMTSEARVGARVLAEVEQTNLEEILNALRAALNPTASKSKRPKSFPIPGLDDVVARNFRATQSAPLSVAGRHLPLVYVLVSTLVSEPHHKTVIIIDAEGRFDATRLTCSRDDLRHVYVYRPARSSPEHLRELTAAGEKWMLYGNHESGAREWWGSIVIGGVGAGDVSAGWKGWMRVDRADVRGFAMGSSAQEAMAARERRQEAVDAAGWVATSQYGQVAFKEGHVPKDEKTENLP